ncbi:MULTISPECIES: sialidase family protein [unclassified Spirosoma]|uniref:sialidase family protein n=1 Tax=unclassified Spirosoma TaxID=2621999 RepID=UPI00095D8862|nr:MULTISPECIES: sialidase family protein [unclassified Spirosoma]MBN8825460.1 exo-alpha-sialidase [Spirosoma sp.]OJW74970.1 MAG: exo-alpha-sialidase [Spirosoma sp. 48-14]
MFYPFMVCLGLAACGFVAPRLADAQAVSTPVKPNLDETVVFRNGEDGYTCYRIPAIVKAPSGELLAFAEGRKTDCGDYGDVDIVLRTSRDNGQTWSPLRVVVDYGQAQAGNPAPVFDQTDSRFRNGRLFLLYNTGTASEKDVRNGKAIREVWYKTSTDGGKSWSDPVNITTSVNRPNKPDVNPSYTFSEDWRSYANTPGHALQIQNGRYKGRLFIAANHSEGAPQAQFRDYRAHGFYSDDHGKTWKLSPTVTYPGGNESTAAETSTGSLLMNSRNQSGDVKSRLLAFSTNAGETWDQVTVANELPDPVCEGSMINYRKGGQNVLIFANLNSQTKREKLTVRISQNDGKSWSAGREIYAGSAAYSDLVIQQDGRVGILYERDNYTTIIYTHFPYDWLTQ